MTPVFLFGTAGLRRFTAAAQRRLLGHARSPDTLAESPFRWVGMPVDTCAGHSRRSI